MLLLCSGEKARNDDDATRLGLDEECRGEDAANGRVHTRSKDWSPDDVNVRNCELDSL